MRAVACRAWRLRVNAVGVLIKIDDPLASRPIFWPCSNTNLPVYRLLCLLFHFYLQFKYPFEFPNPSFHLYNSSIHSLIQNNLNEETKRKSGLTVREKNMNNSTDGPLSPFLQYPFSIQWFHGSDREMSDASFDPFKCPRAALNQSGDEIESVWFIYSTETNFSTITFLSPLAVYDRFHIVSYISINPGPRPV